MVSVLNIKERIGNPAICNNDLQSLRKRLILQWIIFFCLVGASVAAWFSTDIRVYATIPAITVMCFAAIIQTEIKMMFLELILAKEHIEDDKKAK